MIAVLAAENSLSSSFSFIASDIFFIFKEKQFTIFRNQIYLHVMCPNTC